MNSFSSVMEGAAALGAGGVEEALRRDEDLKPWH